MGAIPQRWRSVITIKYFTGPARVRGRVHRKPRRNDVWRTCNRAMTILVAPLRTAIVLTVVAGGRASRSIPRRLRSVFHPIAVNGPGRGTASDVRAHADPTSSTRCSGGTSLWRTAPDGNLTRAEGVTRATQPIGPPGSD